MVKANRPHYHVWRLADGERAYFKLARGFHTRQAAHQFERRREPDKSRYIIRECWRERCKPKL